MGGPPDPFDRAHDLSALLAALPRPKLAAALSALLGEHWRLCDESGATLLAGSQSAGDGGLLPLRHQLDLLGTLCAPDAPPHRAQAAAQMVELLIDAAARLRMTADLHLQAVHEDYRALLEKHAALAESEARHKALAAELDARVQAQVRTIETAQRQLYQAEKMASVGQLAAGVAHEINNPIGFLRSNLNTASDYLRRLEQLAPIARQDGMPVLADAWARNDLDFVLEDFAALIGESLDGAERVARIVAALKDFSSIDAAEEAPADLNENLRTVVRVAQPRLPAGARLQLDLTPLPPLRCHGGRLNQVFLSLLQNACQAVDGEGEIRIASLAGPDTIHIAVSDNGPGIPPEALPRIFDPFFTTREVGKGAGLGLTVARDIVLAHGGRITVDSAPGRGTRAEVVLPLERRP